MSGLKLDVRALHDPAGKQFSHHPGTHPEILKGVVRHVDFKLVLSQFKGLFDDASLNMSIAIFCRAGKHRSVGVALAVEYILKAEGCHVDLTFKGTWTVGRECLVGKCQDCTYAARKGSLDHAMRVWQSL